MGHEKFIGRDLLVGVLSRHGDYARNIYLPRGACVNCHTREWFRSNGQWVNDFSVYIDGVFRLSVFARAGASISMMHVDEQTKDVFDHRKDGTSHNELIVQVYADDAPGKFTLNEDDGETIRYAPDKRPLHNTVQTDISHIKDRRGVTVIIDKAVGSYPGMVRARKNILRVVVEDAAAAGGSDGNV